MLLSDLSIRRPIMISMLLIVFLIFGALSWFTLNLNSMPAVEIPYVSVMTVYPGAGPQEIETQVTKPLEDAIATISRVKKITSYSLEAVSYVIIEFELGKSVDLANQEVKDKTNQVLNELPADAELPVVAKFDINAFPVMDLLLTGEIPQTELRYLADNLLVDRLSQIEGAARVDVVGGEVREIQVSLENRVLFRNSISLQQLAGIIAAQNLNMPGGQFQIDNQELAVRLNGEYSDLEVLRNLEIPTATGPKRLGQIASISDSHADVRERTTYFDNRQKKRTEGAILLSVVKSADGNTVNLADGIREILPEVNSELPGGCQLDIIHDNSVFVVSTVNDTMSNVWLGVLFTGLVLLFFLHDLRSTLIVGLAMPMSLISTLLLVRVSGFTLNIMTLMGLSTSVGILVANSVVVLENIFRHKEMGHNRKLSAAQGTNEIAVAVIASASTNLVVFLPIAAMAGMVGRFFKEFALTVTYATLFSLLISFTLTPMLASLILPDHDNKKHRLGAILEGWFKSWERLYRRILQFLLSRKLYGILLILLTMVLFFGSLPLGGKVGFEFMPSMDEGIVTIEVELPEGYNLDETAQLLQTIESRITHHPEITHVLTRLGNIGSLDVGTNLARMQVKLVDATERDITPVQFANRLMADVATVPNAVIRVSGSASAGGPEDAAITFSLQGQELDRLENFAALLLTDLDQVEGLVNLRTNSRAGKPEIELVPNRIQLSHAGLTVYDLAMVLRSSVEGFVATRYRDAGREYDIRVMLADDACDTPEEIGNLTVVAPDGNYRLAQLCDIRFGAGFSKITREDKFRAIEFKSDIAPGYVLGDLVVEIDRVVKALGLPEGYRADWGGAAQMMQETTRDMSQTLLIAIVLTYMLLAAILESFFQPLLILGTVPLALVGVLVAMFLTGKTFNTISMMAIIMLVGLVVNNGILLLDYTNILRRRGMALREALLEACPTKLKAIIMATVAIVLGMLPLAMGLGAAGREIRQPMGIVSIGGLISSTLLGLLLIPVIYNLFSRQAKTSPAAAPSKEG
ncbi:MAG: efflux RND transporter permease subunit, partial [Candidatus Delongbacteria bacterium]|nr:efflux RND transporter permease subunit [Candidatus Delongbacteria bacterium]